MNRSTGDTNAVLGELGSEEPERSGHLVSQLLDTVDEGLLGERSKVVERYLNGDYACHFHIGLVLLSKADTQKFRPVFGGPSGPLRLAQADDVQVTLCATDLNLMERGNSDNNDHQTMFVGVVHSAQYPQEMPLEVFPLMVRLMRLDQVRC